HWLLIWHFVGDGSGGIGNGDALLASALVGAVVVLPLRVPLENVKLDAQLPTAASGGGGARSLGSSQQLPTTNRAPASASSSSWLWDGLVLALLRDVIFAVVACIGYLWCC